MDIYNGHKIEETLRREASLFLEQGKNEKSRKKLTRQWGLERNSLWRMWQGIIVQFLGRSKAPLATDRIPYYTCRRCALLRVPEEC